MASLYTPNDMRIKHKWLAHCLLNFTDEQNTITLVHPRLLSCRLNILQTQVPVHTCLRMFAHHMPTGLLNGGCQNNLHRIYWDFLFLITFFPV